jgi:hypothetical protein
LPEYHVTLKINRAPLKGQQKMADAFKENCIYVMTKDIYDKEALKKSLSI